MNDLIPTDFIAYINVADITSPQRIHEMNKYDKSIKYMYFKYKDKIDIYNTLSTTMNQTNSSDLYIKCDNFRKLLFYYDIEQTIYYKRKYVSTDIEKFKEFCRYVCSMYSIQNIDYKPIMDNVKHNNMASKKYRNYLKRKIEEDNIKIEKIIKY